MGTSETVPFSTEEAALTFVKEHGGEVMGFAKIPVDYVLSNADMADDDDFGAVGAELPDGSHATY